MPVIPKRLPVCPGRDSRFTLRRMDDGWWVHYQHPDGTLIPADEPHPELVNLVNELKAAEGGGPGGAFSLNEHCQVIARMGAPEGYQQNSIFVVDVSLGAVQRYTAVITFKQGQLDPAQEPAEGSSWLGPLCGSTYRFAAPGNRKPPSNKSDEVWTEIEGQIDLLSSHIQSSYPPTIGALADFISALRRQLPSGGRFRVNERRRAFTSNGNIFIGTVPLRAWFPPLTVT